MLEFHRAALAGQVLSGQPLAHEAHMIGADVLVRDKNIQRVGCVQHLMEQKIGLRDLFARGKGPVGANALAFKSTAGAGVSNGGILKAPGGH